VFEVAVLRMAVAGRERAGVITHLDLVAEAVIWLVGMGFVAVLAPERWHGFQSRGELSAVGHGQRPGAEAAGRTRIITSSE
jgi:hypothetical protein